MQQSNSHYESSRRMKAEMSRHARLRSQQRGIPVDAVPLYQAYGERSHDGKGGIRYLMTERAMANLIRAAGRSQRIDALAGTYIVVSADDERTVITMSHLYS